MTKIVLTGPESTGKTVLARYLSTIFRAPYQIEYARQYLEQLERPYTLRDLHEMADGQFYRRDRQTPLHPDVPYLICDTDAVVFQIWAKEKFHVYLKRATEDLRKYPGDYYLLCRPDLDWEPDPLRENPHDRDRLFRRYRAYLERTKLPYGIVEGDGPERFERAVTLLEGRFPDLRRPSTHDQPEDSPAFVREQRRLGADRESLRNEADGDAP